MRTRKITLSGYEFELMFSTRAMLNISERCGGELDNLGNWIDAGTTAERIQKLCFIISDLANGAIIAHNASVAMGLENGEKKDLYDPDDFVDLINIAEIMNIRDTIFDTMAAGNEHEVPEGVTIEEKDLDLAEIEAEKKRKN